MNPEDDFFLQRHRSGSLSRMRSQSDDNVHLPASHEDEGNRIQLKILSNADVAPRASDFADLKNVNDLKKQQNSAEVFEQVSSSPEESCEDSEDSNDSNDSDAALPGDLEEEYGIKPEKPKKSHNRYFKRADEECKDDPPLFLIQPSDHDEVCSVENKPKSKLLPVNYEVDFYDNPTTLSRLILNEKYSSAMRRLYDYPEEAAIWVCAKRMSSQSSSEFSIQKSSASDRGLLSSYPKHHQSGVYTIRQLPVHMAVANLRRTHDTKMLKVLNDLIANLIFANPEGSHDADHSGKYPLHEAIWHGAVPETISLFLLANPFSVKSKDYKGRSLLELNKHGVGQQKADVQHLLELDIGFWENARKEAMFRLMRNQVKFPSDSESIGSLSVMASSKADEESIQPLTSFDKLTAEEQLEVNKDKPANVVALDSAEVSAARSDVTPHSWEQLEKRTIATERLLTEMNEKYYELSKKMDALSYLGSSEHNTLTKEITRLSRENNHLNQKLYRLETILMRLSAVNKDMFSDDSRKELEEISSLVDLETDPPSYDLDNMNEGDEKLKAQLGTLSESHKRQREKIRRLTHAVGLLLTQQDSFKSFDSSMSQLTSKSAKSYYSRMLEKHKSDVPIVDFIPKQSMQARGNENAKDENEVDDLNDMFKLAAEDAIQVSPRGKIIRKLSTEKVVGGIADAPCLDDDCCEDLELPPLIPSDYEFEPITGFDVEHACFPRRKVWLCTPEEEEQFAMCFQHDKVSSPEEEQCAMCFPHDTEEETEVVPTLEEEGKFAMCFPPGAGEV